tara:strand:+ start:71 stop:520 length:450 start_codon:yes stop_codon:yes gene_type:complete
LILNKGLWYGKGSVLVENASLGESVEVDIEVTEDEEGYTISGSLLDSYTGEVSIRVAPNDVGTYSVDARVAGVALDGIGKLESEPNLILLWNEGQTLSVSAAIFMAGNGIGCRGFLRENNRTLTWEMLITLKQQAIKGDNVVSFFPRRR